MQLKKTKKPQVLRIVKQLEWYSFVLPTIICLLVLTYVPLIECIKYSFSKINLVTLQTKYVGFKNYLALLKGAGFTRALMNTAILSVLSLVTIPLGFILATILHSFGQTKKQTFFRVMFYLPNIITGVSVVLLFRYIFLRHGGLLNSALSVLAGHEVSIGWMTDPQYSKIAATIKLAWTGVGYAMLINLAGIQSIPTEIYEAASVDGANAWRRWIHITIPNLKDTFAFLVITGMISGFERFTDLYLLGGNSTAGNPSYSLQTVLMYIYQYSFEAPNYGLSSAGAMILFFIILGLTLINLKATGFFKKDKLEVRP